MVANDLTLERATQTLDTFADGAPDGLGVAADVADPDDVAGDVR